MKRNIMKFILSFLVLVMFISLISIPIAQAAGGFSGINVDTLTQNAQDKSNAGNSILKFIQGLLVVIQVSAMGAAVIMLIVLAIKYLAAAPSERADIKKSAMIYVVGSIILFGASGILAIIRNFSVKNISRVSSN